MPPRPSSSFTRRQLPQCRGWTEWGQAHLGEDEDVIDKNEDELIQNIVKNVICQHLEHPGGVGHTKGHNEIFTVPQQGVESRFVLIALTNPDPMVCIPKVELGEDLGSM